MLKKVRDYLKRIDEEELERERFQRELAAELSIPETIRHARIGAGFTCGELNEACKDEDTGFNPHLEEIYEAGRACPSLYILNEIAKACGLKLKVTMETK